MEKVQKKDFFVVSLYFFLLTLAFLGLYFKDEIFNSQNVDIQKAEEQKEEKMFKYTPVDEANFVDICPETILDERDGKEYEVVQIGKQCWLAENLKYEVEGAICPEESDLYGCYYKWEVAKEACPDEWKLASDDEWKTLEIQLGMSIKEAHKNHTYRYTFLVDQEVGGQLKSEEYWNKPNECYGECNTSGFNALPSGNLGEEDVPQVGERSFFWTASKTEETDYDGAIIRTLDNSGAGISRENTGGTHFYSVRCLME